MFIVFATLSVIVAQPIPVPEALFSKSLLRGPLSVPQGVVEKSDAIEPEIQWNALASTARITTTGGELGTAVAVGVRDGFLYLLTANHVVSSPGNRQLEFFTRETYRDPEQLKKHVFQNVDVAIRISRADLAVLKVDLGKRPPPPIMTVPQPWDRPRQFPATAFSIGCTEARSPTCRLETIIGKPLVRRTNDNGSFFWQVSQTTIQGRSGGPLVDPKGRLIGICAATQKEIGYFTHLDEIHAGLKKDGFSWIWDSVAQRNKRNN